MSNQRKTTVLPLQEKETHTHQHDTNEKQGSAKKNCCGDCKNGGVGACGRLMKENSIVKKIESLVQK